MSSLSQQQREAAQLFVGVTIDALKTDRGVHAETAVAAIARMAGTFLFRSFAFPLSEVEPGQAVFSDAANEQGPRLIQILGSVLSHVGVHLDRSRLGASISTTSQPQLAFLDTQRQMEPLLSSIKGRFNLSYQEAADASAVATALLIQQCTSVLDPHTAFDVAAYSFVEGAKTAPDPVTCSAA